LAEVLVKIGDSAWTVPETQGYLREGSLQGILAAAPHLIPGHADAPAIVAREVALSESCYVDLVAVDSLGRVTLVECKLARNAEIKRTIVGQIFAYAAAGWELSYEDFDARMTRGLGNVPLAVRARQLFATPGQESPDVFDDQRFREGLLATLRDGTFRLVLAVDEITDELRKSVRFVNAHTTTSVEFLAIELGYARHGDVELLVPKTYGTEIVARKRAINDLAARQEFLTLLERLTSPAQREVFQELVESFTERENVSAYFRSRSANVRYNRNGKFVSLWNAYLYDRHGTLEPNFPSLVAHLDDATLRQLAEALNALPSADNRFADLKDYSKRPGLQLGRILNGAAVDGLVRAYAPVLETLCST
jgi:hypothetical protein